MKDHELCELVNGLTDIACAFHDHATLRDRIAQELWYFARNAGWLCPHDREGGEMNWPDAMENTHG